METCPHRARRSNEGVLMMRRDLFCRYRYRGWPSWAGLSAADLHQLIARRPSGFAPFQPSAGWTQPRQSSGNMVVEDSGGGKWDRGLKKLYGAYTQPVSCRPIYFRCLVVSHANVLWCLCFNRFHSVLFQFIFPGGCNVPTACHCF